MYVIHTLPGLLSVAEQLQMTKINVKDKANQTSLSVGSVFVPSQPIISCHIPSQASCCHHRLNGNDCRTFETTTGITQDQAEHGRSNRYLTFHPFLTCHCWSHVTSFGASRKHHRYILRWSRHTQKPPSCSLRQGRIGAAFVLFPSNDTPIFCA
jgi:hypothetical protein